VSTLTTVLKLHQVQRFRSKS